VIDYDPRPGRTSAERADLIAEVMDDTREEVENRLLLHRDLPDCIVLLAIEPGWVCVHVSVKEGLGAERTYRTLGAMED
jgi:hypothetical protein